MLSLDVPKWQLVYYYYRKWAALLDFDLLLGKLRVHIMRREVKTRNQADSQMETQRFLKKVKGHYCPVKAGKSVFEIVET